ncbi:I78 family peptidase inhibitor [Pseudomonas sp. X10]
MTNEEALQALETLIGTPYEPSVKATISELTGRLRVVGPSEFTTREYDLQRITIVVDEDDAIQGFRFG